MITVWLVVQLYLGADKSILLDNEKMESVAACTARAAEILAASANVVGDDGWELGAACSVEKMPDLPVENEK